MMKIIINIIILSSRQRSLLLFILLSLLMIMISDHHQLIMMDYYKNYYYSNHNNDSSSSSFIAVSAFVVIRRHRHNTNNNNNNNNNNIMSERFQQQLLQQQTKQYLSLSSSSLSSSSSSVSSSFEYQELKILLDNMIRQNVRYSDIPNMIIKQRNEMISYIESIIQNSIQDNDIMDDRFLLNNVNESNNNNINMRLVFSTDPMIQTSLPNDATIYIQFLTNSICEYQLQFSTKTFLLKCIKILCNYQKYNKIMNTIIELQYTNQLNMDIGSCQNVAIPVINELIKDRIQYIPIVYYDNTIWIEQGYTTTATTTTNNIANMNNDNTNDESLIYYNVYVRQ